MGGNRWKTVTLEDRLWAKIQEGPYWDDGLHCWDWTGTKTATGYGSIYRDGKRIQAHRASYELYVGPVPEGLELDHLCKRPCCVRPEHLEPVTRRENILRGNGWSGRNARKTHCPRGHEYTSRNTSIDRNGSRRCLTCHRDRERVRRQQKLSTYSHPNMDELGDRVRRLVGDGA